MAATTPGIFFVDGAEYHTLGAGEVYEIAAPKNAQGATWDRLDRIWADVDSGGELRLTNVFWPGAPTFDVTLKHKQKLEWGFNGAEWPAGAKIKCENPAGSGGEPVSFRVMLRGWATS